MLITIALVSLGGCSDGTDPEAILTAAAVAASNGQAALVGTALPLPLRVEVASDGTPKEGVTVTWQTSAGSVAPTSSVTDATGLAATTWTLGTVPGVMTTAATVAGAQGSPVTFSATALAPAVGGRGRTHRRPDRGGRHRAFPAASGTGSDRRAPDGRDSRILADVRLGASPPHRR